MVWNTERRSGDASGSLELTELDDAIDGGTKPAISASAAADDVTDPPQLCTDCGDCAAPPRPVDATGGVGRRRGGGRVVAGADECADTATTRVTRVAAVGA